jgi:dTDP-4-dehydrorhamnose 3,5-epimerase-like enzyme
MYKILKLDSIGNKEIGFLSFFEDNKETKFEFKRIYYVYDVPIKIKRGMHAHKKLNQLLWCPYGAIKVVLDDGINKETYILDKPETALIINKGIWRDLYFKKKKSVLCVAASDYYDENDYIRDYDLFLKLVKEGYWKK